MQHMKNSRELNDTSLDWMIWRSIMHEATRALIHDLIDTDYDNSLVAEL